MPGAGGVLLVGGDLTAVSELAGAGRLSGYVGWALEALYAASRGGEVLEALRLLEGIARRLYPDPPWGRRPLAYLWVRVYRCPGGTLVPAIPNPVLDRQRGIYLAFEPGRDEVRIAVARSSDLSDLPGETRRYRTLAAGRRLRCPGGVYLEYGELQAQSRASNGAGAPLRVLAAIVMPDGSVVEPWRGAEGPSPDELREELELLSGTGYTLDDPLPPGGHYLEARRWGANRVSGLFEPRALALIAHGLAAAEREDLLVEAAYLLAYWAGRANRHTRSRHPSRLEPRDSPTDSFNFVAPFLEADPLGGLGFPSAPLPGAGASSLIDYQLSPESLAAPLGCAQEAVIHLPFRRETPLEYLRWSVARRALPGPPPLGRARLAHALASLAGSGIATVYLNDDEPWPATHPRSIEEALAAGWIPSAMRAVSRGGGRHPAVEATLRPGTGGGVLDPGRASEAEQEAKRAGEAAASRGFSALTALLSGLSAWLSRTGWPLRSADGGRLTLRDVLASAAQASLTAYTEALTGYYDPLLASYAVALEARRLSTRDADALAAATGVSDIWILLAEKGQDRLQPIPLEEAPPLPGGLGAVQAYLKSGGIRPEACGPAKLLATSSPTGLAEKLQALLEACEKREEALEAWMPPN